MQLAGEERHFRQASLAASVKRVQVVSADADPTFDSTFSVTTSAGEVSTVTVHGGAYSGSSARLVDYQVVLFQENPYALFDAAQVVGSCVGDII